MNGKAKVLVIDDQPSIATTMALIFSKAGYECRGVGSAEAALALMETEAWVPQLAIIDVQLPAMNGIDLAILLQATHPDVRVCLFSGQAATSDLLEAARQQGHYFEVLAKPLHPTVFLDLASSVVGDAGRSIDAPH